MAPDTQLLPLDAEELLQEIRNRHQRGVSESHPAEAVQFYPFQSNDYAHGSQVPSDENFPELNYWLQFGRQQGRMLKKKPMRLFTSRLTSLDTQSRTAVSGIGEAPPTPPTVRGRLGRWVILAIQRLLWWYTQPLRSFAEIADQRFRECAAAAEHLGNLQEEHSRRLAAEVAAREALADKLMNVIEEYGQFRTHSGAMQRSAEQTPTEVTFNDRPVGMLPEEARGRLPGPFSVEQVNRLPDVAEHEMDAVYVAFENAFRGTREDVKQRQSIYLSHLANAQAGTPDRPILDLGCGRGEWLELLREHQLAGKGIDRNRVMLDICRTAGLEVVEADVLSFTRTLPDASFGAITAFHLVEHLPFDVVTALLDEALRVLKPGGLLILETPNPGNVMVASHHFYLDPTHLKPLPIPMLRFFVEAKGFRNTRILTLHPNPVPLTSRTDAVSQRLNELFTGPQDYAVLAERP